MVNVLVFDISDGGARPRVSKKPLDKKCLTGITRL
jgi:hypothetical protein